MSARLASPPPSLNANPRIRHQQLKQQLRALQTSFQTYTTTPTPQTLLTLLPALHHHTSQLTLHLPHLSLPLLLPVLPTLLDLLDAVADLPLVQAQALVADVLSVLVWWAKGAGRWVRSVEDKASTVYVEVEERVREGYVRLGAAAEQWAAAVTLSTTSNPAASTLLPPLLTSLTLSLPYLSPAPRDSSWDLLLSALHSSATCNTLLSSPHLVDLLTSFPSALSSSPPARLLTVTEAVLSLWRHGGVTAVRQYDEYRAVMVYMAGVGALVKEDTTTATQLQQLCSAAVSSSASVASQSLFAVFGTVGALHALDPKAALYKRHREKGETITDSNDIPRLNTAASPSSSSTTSAALPHSTATSISHATTPSAHTSVVVALQSSFQSTVDPLLSSCTTSAAALSTMSAPSFAATQCGILSAACVNGVEWLQWSQPLFSFITTTFLTLIDTRWCIAPSLSLSAPAVSRNNAAMEWTRSSFFSMLPHYSRAFSMLFLSAPLELQCAALAQVRNRMRGIQRQWQRHNHAGHDTTRAQQSVTTAMEQDSAEEEDDHSNHDTTTNDSLTNNLTHDINTTSALSSEPPPATQPPVDKHTLIELQNTLFLSVCMALATVCKPSLLSTLPVSAVCDVVDTLGWLEFVRVNFTAYRDVVVAVVNEGLRREAADQQVGDAKQRTAVGKVGGSDKQPGWLSWLIGWRRHKQQGKQRSAAEDILGGSRPPQQSSELVHTFIQSYLLPSVARNHSTAASSLAPSAGSLLPSSTFTPLLLLDDGDLVDLSRHYFLLGLLSEWQDGCTSSDALSMLVPYSASFLHCRVRGVLKRAHGLFVRSLALIVRHHSLQQTDEATDGYAVFISAFLPYTRLALAQYPLQLGVPTLMDSLVLLFHLLPSNHPLLLDASHAIVDRIQQLTDRTLASVLSSSAAPGVVFIAGDSLQVPTSLRHLLILHFQLVQLLSLSSFRSALSRTGALFPTTTGSASVVSGVYGGMLSLLRDVIVRNFDLYRRDEAVRWWMTVKERSGIVLAVPGPAHPLPIAAPSITTIKPTT